MYGAGMRKLSQDFRPGVIFFLNRGAFQAREYQADALLQKTRHQRYRAKVDDRHMADDCIRLVQDPSHKLDKMDYGVGAYRVEWRGILEKETEM